MEVDVRSLVGRAFGLLAVGLLLLAVVLAVPDPPDAPARAWQPPDGYRLTSTLTLADDRELRLWTGTSGWYVEQRRSGRTEAGVGAGGGGDRYDATEILGGLVVRVPAVGARSILVRSTGGTVRGLVDAGTSLVPVPPPGVDSVVVLPLDAAGTPLIPEVTVAVAGRE
ncbi:hypothetical protein [Micromonospora cathayae]|uniref:Uncharacterized protein n=1 Tax=Micromonospora cathayae TaxID=3028804 RepID=A0ABY7ZJW1_9ACTN|nr:hypothetical protein [Micromonospora sp. HUAS 3]WDZ83241.1 hypothetical protein PVK37_22650 [Micromonospora sp. HUAS 3]